MWNPGDIIVGRAVFRNRIWNAAAMITVKDTPQETVAALLLGAECRAETDYAKGGKSGKRRWDFKDADWELTPFRWRMHPALVILEPDKFYSIRLFWQEDSSRFLGYYVNFQLPVRRTHCGVDSLDLELDVIVHPDLSFEWKDLDEYQKGLETGIILPEWADEIETAKTELLDRLEKRRYPFDGCWVDWKADPNWSPPTLPENWDKI